MTPQTGRHIHMILLVAWVVVGFPVSYVLRNSITWVVVLSVYAIVVSHWAGWSAERPTEIAEE